jgi:hypothetical protein
VGTIDYTPKADKQLLILHYTVQNPLKQDQHFTWNDFQFTVLDNKDLNYSRVC